MKVIIAGPRSFHDHHFIYKKLEQVVDEHKWIVDEVVSGGAIGTDEVGENWAKYKQIDIRIFPAKWNTEGRGAGHIRNKRMAEYADALIAFWDGESTGTNNMINQAKKQGLKVKVIGYE